MFGVSRFGPTPKLALVGTIAGFTTGLYRLPGRATRLAYRKLYPTEVLSQELQA